MRTAILLTAAMLNSGAGYPNTLQGEWRQVDVRSIEAGRQGDGTAPCLRIWLEQRTYSLRVEGSRADGVYANTLKAIPLGTVGNHPDCRFQPPASEPLSAHSRTWQVVGSRTEAGEWMISGSHGSSLGPFDDLDTPSFSTTLRLDGGRLIEVRENFEVSFTRPGEPWEAREELERGIEVLYTGGCVGVYEELEVTPAAVSKIDEVCDLIDRAKRFTGRFEGIEVDKVEPFDAIPQGFPDPTSTNWINRPGVLFDYRILFEHQDLFGTAIVWQKEGRWRLAFVW